MNLRELSDTSIAASLIKYLFRWYQNLKQSISDIYNNSQTYRFSDGLWKKVRICFKYSFLGRITETEQMTAAVPALLDNSHTVQYLTNFYSRWKDKLLQYSSTSLSTELTKGTKKELYFSPVRITSIIVITAIAINIFLSIFLQKQIDLWGWLIRGLFLFVAVAGLFCKADWPALKSGSLFLRGLEKG